MNMKQNQIWMLLLAALACREAVAQGFTSGSTGAYGPLNVTTDTTLPLPADGIFNCTTISVAAGATLRFSRNALNTPVYLLATGDVAIDGTIDVSGSGGSSTPPIPGQAGPGGFDGGMPGGNFLSPGAGQGPGGGTGTTSVNFYPGNGAFGERGGSPLDGTNYGSPLLVPLIGGSGGGGGTNSVGNGGAGGGGGGAILVASNTRITVTGTGLVIARGGPQTTNIFGGGVGGAGSGGAVRMVAPIVAGTGRIDVRGGAYAPGYDGPVGGSGRTRIDAIDRSGLTITVDPLSSFTSGALMVVSPNPVPRLDIIEAAGTTIPEGTASAVAIQLPTGSSTNRTVTVQARNFGYSVPITVALVPDSGPPLLYEATIDNAAANPATAVVNVGVPVNTVVHVNAWSR